MTISGSGLNVNFSPTPSINERESTAQTQLQKEGAIGQGNVVMVPQSQQDLISFTTMAKRTTLNYKSETPSLAPPKSAERGSGPQFETNEEGWEDNYAGLFDKLPADLKALLAKDPSLLATVTVVLEIAAKVLDWQKGAIDGLNSENAINRALENANLPQAAFGGSYLTTKELVDFANEYLNAAGPNDPTYGDLKEFILQAGGLINEIHP